MAETLQTREHQTDETVFEVRNATVRFGMDRGESRVLDDVDVDLERNEIFGVVGESGSGKSMFASALLDAVVDPGVLTGEITYYPSNGDPVDVLDLSDEELRQFRWEEVSMVFQGAMSSLNPVRTIETHFVETLSAHDHPVEAGMERARDLLSELYLDPERVLGAYPHELSGGMRQRILIALSLLLEPEVLVMDEPTAALDLLMQRSIISLIEEIQSKFDLTIVFITHDLSLIVNLADRLGVLYAFDFVEVGPAERLLRRSAHPYTRALLNSTPNLETPVEEMRGIEGSSPDPTDTPSGCAYHPRCPLADTACREVDPQSSAVDDGHYVHCHYWDEVPDEIPLRWRDDQHERNAPDVMENDGSERPDAEPVVSLDDVEVHFEQERGSKLNPFAEPQTVRAVDGVDLDVYPNDVVVLVGESGSGKTTLGKVAIGIQEPTGGTVEYRGQDIWKAKRRLGDVEIPYEDIRQSLQIIHQDPGSSLNSMRRVKAILEDPLKRWYPQFGSEKRRDLITRMLDHVGLTPADDYVERYPHQLSGGEQQRVALVRSMLVNPELILADEPVSALDVSLRVEVMDLMVELQSLFDTSFLFISHDLSNARYIAQKMDGRIAIMYLGEIVEIGTPEEVIRDPKHPYTKALKWATTSLDPSELGANETPVRSIDIPEPTDPPKGCRYHTRCAAVIPPDEFDLGQAEWNSIVDLKEAVEAAGPDGEITAAITDSDRVREHATGEEFQRAVRDHFDIPAALSDDDADDVLEEVIARLFDGDREGAETLLEDRFSTVCRQRSPQSLLDDPSTGSRNVACFRDSDEFDSE